jgi:hypothetical protein
MHSVISFVNTVLTGCDRMCLVCSNQSDEQVIFLTMLCILTVLYCKVILYILIVLILQSNLIHSQCIDVAK